MRFVKLNLVSEEVYSFVASKVGNYTIKTYATPKGSKEGEGSLTDVKTIYVSDSNSPTYSNLITNKTMIAVREEIIFTASSDYATGFTIGIDNETSRYLTQEMPNGQLQQFHLKQRRKEWNKSFS